jgi:hypothetical protein
MVSFLTTSGVRFTLNKATGRWEPQPVGIAVSTSAWVSTGSHST